MTPVRFETDAPVCIVTIDRPHKRNAVDGETAAALRDAFERFEADDALRVAILTGAGGHFCGGADLAVMGDPARRNAFDREGGGSGPMGPTRMTLSKPLIAAVDGYAVAGGLELALPMVVAEGEAGAARFAAGAGRHGAFAQPGATDDR